MQSQQTAVTTQVHADKGVAVITLNRPEKRNAINQEVIDRLAAALEDLRKNDSVRVVLLRGNGPTFCAGMDLNFLRAQEHTQMQDWERSNALVELLNVIKGYPKVTIAEVQGYCLGGGMALAFSHDLIVASRNAQIGMPEVLRGSFGQLATSTLHHAGIPTKKAMYLHLTSRNASGEEADRLGLISKVFEENELQREAMALATEIATRHPAALSSAKIAVQMGSHLALPQAMRLDQLVGAWQRLMVDPLEHVGDYLKSQKEGLDKGSYRRPDV